MSYITNANARINILSTTAVCREYKLFAAHHIIHRRVLQRFNDPLVGWGKGRIGAVDSQENH